MRYEEYCQILDRIDSDPKLNNQDTKDQYVIDAIKEILKAEYPDVYKEWEGKEFDINHLFHYQEPGYASYTFTLLYTAASGNKINTLKALLATGADINATEDVFKRTPLHWAAGSKRINIDTIKFLLENGAKVNAIDIYGETPLHFAIRYGNESTVNALLAQKGINVNIADIDGMTPLHQAIIYHQINIVNALLKKEANPLRQDKRGNTPLHLAVKYGYKDAIKTLLLAGANTSLENNDGNTPIDSTISDEIKKLFKDTENELHKMQNEKIGGTNISFYEFLQASQDRLKIYVRNVNLCTELKKCQYEIDYPIYASMIGDRFRIGIEIKCLEKNASIALENYVPTFNKDICGLIISYLTEVDLKSVIRSADIKIL